jgi:hypothetical protein
MIGRLVALLILAAVAWVAYTYARPADGRLVQLEKGVYKGQPVTPLTADTVRRLEQRALTAGGESGRLE